MEPFLLANKRIIKVWLSIFIQLNDGLAVTVVSLLLLQIIIYLLNILTVYQTILNQLHVSVDK